jgi:hypothetical protein
MEKGWEEDLGLYGLHFPLVQKQEAPGFLKGLPRYGAEGVENGGAGKLSA